MLSRVLGMDVLIAGDVSLNPGPKYQSFTDVASSRGLKIAHLNLRSLRNKLVLVGPHGNYN